MLKDRIDKRNIKNDIFSGIIVALVTIPIAMGYAQVAGLPVEYGLYGSLLPVLIFGLISTSKMFIVGVDALPAAMVGGSLAGLGIVAYSEDAITIVPIITLFVGIWLLVFYGFKAGRIINYISRPVMGGFITGVGITIILMQIPKLFGGEGASGELFQLIAHIAMETDDFNKVAAILGFGTAAIIIISKKLFPRFPMSIIMMVLGAVSTVFFDIEAYGVNLLPEVATGLPDIMLPKLGILKDRPLDFTLDLILLSFSIAAVVMAQTLLATNSYALKYNFKVNNNREILGYSMANFAGCLMGASPINGSVSRTGLADQFGCKSQLASIIAAFTMLLMLLFGTGVFEYLPIPVLTGIVVAALFNILEIKLARNLWKTNKNEFVIFITAMLGVLIFGTIYGVVIGVLLSFGMVVIKAVVPPKAFLGVIPGHDDFNSLDRNKNAKPIENTIIYRFSGNLFFANINTFCNDIEGAIKEDTKQVIVDARGIGNIDITAAERLVILNRNLKEQGIAFYITEHAGNLNDQLRKFGAISLIENGNVRRTVSLALRDAGVEKPYPLEGTESSSTVFYIEASERLAEFEWAFGKDTERKMRQMAKEIIEKLTSDNFETLVDVERETSWGRIGLFDEDELLDYMEMHLEEGKDSGKFTEEEVRALEEKIERRRLVVEDKLKSINSKAYGLLVNHRKSINAYMKKENPEAYANVKATRKKLKEELKNNIDE